jgi:hypothetical protein
LTKTQNFPGQMKSLKGQEESILYQIIKGAAI